MTSWLACFGGQLVPLTASHEHRVAALLAIDGMINLEESFLHKFPQQLVQCYQASNGTTFDATIRDLYNTPGISIQFK
jgi:hypothetical protein